MGQLGCKGMLLFSALALAVPATVPAQANGGGSAGAGGKMEEDATGTAGGKGDATGSIGGAAPAPEGTSGGTGVGVSTPGATQPGDASRAGHPCPSGYVWAEDSQMCGRP